MNDPSTTTLSPPTPADMGRKARTAGLAGQAPEPRKVRSRKVNGYVLAVLKHERLKVRLEAKIEALKQGALGQKVSRAHEDLVIRRGTLNAGQWNAAHLILLDLGMGKGS